MSRSMLSLYRRHRPRSFDEVVKLAYANRIQLWSDGFYRTPKIHYDKVTLTGRPFFYFAYGAACSEVAIDTLIQDLAMAVKPGQSAPLRGTELELMNNISAVELTRHLLT